MPVRKPAKKITAKLSAASVRTRKGIATEALRRKGFLQMCADAGLEAPDCDVEFALPRKFRFDFCWWIHSVALESDGNGRHTRWAGFRRDQEKTNEAAIRGFSVLRVPSSELCTDATIVLVKRALEARR